MTVVLELSVKVLMQKKLKHYFLNTFADRWYLKLP